MEMPNIIDGTKGDDKIAGTDKVDVIAPSSGNNVVSSSLGDDKIIINPAKDGVTRLDAGEGRDEKDRSVETDKDNDKVLLLGSRSALTFTNDGSAIIVTSKENPNFKLETYNVETFQFQDGSQVSAQELQKQFQAEGRDTSKTKSNELQEIAITLQANGVRMEEMPNSAANFTPSTSPSVEQSQEQPLTPVPSSGRGR